MGHDQLEAIFGRRGLLALAFAIGLASVLGSGTSCGRLQPELVANGSSGSGDDAGSAPEPASIGDVILDGGPPDAVTKTACGDSTEQLSHTRGVGLDISSAVGYRADPSVKEKVAALLPRSASLLASQMRGTPPTSGGSKQFNDIYRTLDDTSSHIRGILFRDGPRGVNLEALTYTGAFGSAPLNFGPGYATAFPVTVARAATWDLDLEFQIGEDLADEVLASGNTMTISPCVNILRHPAWGRAQETYGEDSFAIGRMGTAYVDGVQNYVPACVKHFAANNIEDGRFSQNAVMDDQTLIEVYGRHFEMIVQDGGVACVMASYNSINGTKNTQNRHLLTDILRGTFGFKGFVMSDFWAMPNAQSTYLLPAQYSAAAQSAVNAGLDLEMPWALNFQNVEGIATMDQLTTAATHILAQKIRFNIDDTESSSQTLGLHHPLVTSVDTSGVTNNDSHLADAERQAEEAMVLLKNDKNTLPIPRDGSVKSIAVIGAAVPWTLSGTMQSGTVNFATDPRIGDLGSSRVANDPAKSVGPFQGIQQAAGSITVTSGTNPGLADNADFVVVVAGLTPQDEGEEYTGAGDRTNSAGIPNFNLDPKSGTNAQNNLIAAVAAKNKPMVVVIEAGSAVNMPWLSSVPAVVMAWYPGEAGGTALGKLLFGDTNFSGKLPITWPKSEADEPPFNQGGTNGGSTTMDYYLGYRYFDKFGETPLFAYGAGLSYATFQYSFLGVPCTSVTKNGVVDVQVAVTNTGTVPGNEVSFLFVSYPKTTARRSVKELKGFHRTAAPIMPGATVLFTIPLRVQDLKYWNSSANPPAWTVESGPVQIRVGPSSDNLPLNDTIMVQ